jgi:hypothetical protein
VERLVEFLAPATLAWDELIVPAAVREALTCFCSHAPGGGATAVVSGPAGVGKTTAIRVCAEHLRLDLRRVDCRLLVERHGNGTSEHLPGVLSAGERPHAVMLFDDAGWLFERIAGGAGERLLELAAKRRPPTVLESRARIQALEGRVLEIVVPVPGPEERAALWRQSAWRLHPLLDLDVDRLAAVEATAAEIEAALESLLDAPGDPVDATSNLLRLVRRDPS